MKKRIFASLLAICMLATSAFAAETVVFVEDFEIEPINNFFVGTPEIRAYSNSNLLTDSTGTSVSGTFEDGTLNQVAAGFSSGKVSADTAHTGSQSLKFTTSNGKDAAAALFYLDASEIENGDVIEIEAYVKSENPYGVGLFNRANATENKTYFKDNTPANGSMVETMTCAPDWQRVVTRYCFTTAPAETFNTNMAMMMELNIRFSRSTNEYKPVYVDDISIRKVTNAVQVASGAHEGMLTYPISALAGKSNAQVGIDVKNTTASAKDITLITAYYNTDGSLGKVLNVYNTSVPVSNAIQHIRTDEFAVPAGYTAGDIKVFVWNNAQQLLPYTNVTDSEDVLNHERTADTDTEAAELWTKPLPTTENLEHPVYQRDRFNSDFKGYSTSAFTYSVESGNAKSGVRALFIPTVPSPKDSTVSTAGITFEVKPGTKYRLDAYVNASSSYSVALCVSGAIKPGLLNDLSMTMPGTWTSTDTKLGLTNQTANEKVVEAQSLAIGTTRYMTLHTPEANANQWMKVSYTFTTPAADALANDYGASATYAEDALYWETFGNHLSLLAIPSNYTVSKTYQTGKGAWIDDITLVEITD